MPTMPMKSLPHGRPQHFQYGQTPFASKANGLIYGTPPKAAPNIPKQQPVPRTEPKPSADNVRFLYGTNENTRSIMDHSYKRANIVATMDAKTSSTDAFSQQKTKHALDGQREYSAFLERKQQQAEAMKEEKRRDLELLKTYRPPWWDHGHRSEPCKLPSTKHSPTEEQFPDCLGFGKPGNGAPLRSGSGNVKAVLKLDPETRFQKRDRHQTLEVVEPNQTHRRRNPRTSSINVLGQQRWGRTGNENPTPDATCNIFGQPVSDRYGEMRPVAAKRRLQPGTTNCGLDVQSSVTGKVTDPPITVTKKVTGGRRNKQAIEEQVQKVWGDGAGQNNNNVGVPITTTTTTTTAHITTITKDIPPHHININNNNNNNNNNNDNIADGFHPWGRCGGGAPNRDEQGNPVTQKRNGDLVAPVRKSDSEKELERKDLETQKKNKNSNNNSGSGDSDAGFVENGNYYRMHLDAQREKEIKQQEKRANNIFHLTDQNETTATRQQKKQHQQQSRRLTGRNGSRDNNNNNNTNNNNNNNNNTNNNNNKDESSYHRSSMGQPLQKQEQSELRYSSNKPPTDTTTTSTTLGDGPQHGMVPNVEKGYVPSAQEEFEKQKSSALLIERKSRTSQSSVGGGTDIVQQQQRSQPSVRKDMESSGNLGNHGNHGNHGHSEGSSNNFSHSHHQTSNENSQVISAGASSDDVVERFPSQPKVFGTRFSNSDAVVVQHQEREDLHEDGDVVGRSGPKLSQSLKKKLEVRRASQL